MCIISKPLLVARCSRARADLTMHHMVEERHIFPLLAKRMPAFKNDEQHIKSHHGIHEGEGPRRMCSGEKGG